MKISLLFCLVLSTSVWAENLDRFLMQVPNNGSNVHIDRHVSVTSNEGIKARDKAPKTDPELEETAAVRKEVTVNDPFVGNSKRRLVEKPGYFEMYTNQNGKKALAYHLKQNQNFHLYDMLQIADDQSSVITYDNDANQFVSYTICKPVNGHKTCFTVTPDVCTLLTDRKVAQAISEAEKIAANRNKVKYTMGETRSLMKKVGALSVSYMQAARSDFLQLAAEPLSRLSHSDHRDAFAEMQHNMSPQIFREMKSMCEVMMASAGGPGGPTPPSASED